MGSCGFGFCQRYPSCPNREGRQSHRMQANLSEDLAQWLRTFTGVRARAYQVKERGGPKPPECDPTPLTSCPLIAKSGHEDECQNFEIFQNRFYGNPPLNPQTGSRISAVQGWADKGYRSAKAKDNGCLLTGFHKQFRTLLSDLAVGFFFARHCRPTLFCDVVTSPPGILFFQFFESLIFL